MIGVALGCVLTLATTLLGCLPDTAVRPDAGGDGAGRAVTYTKDVQPIFMAKCTPCHAGQNQGQQNIASNYADVQKPVQSLDALGCWNDAEMTMPKTVGECALISIMRGWMPMGMSCYDTPRPPTCISLAEQDVIAAWVAAGMPQ